jgi:hypothetical protein
VKTAPPKAASVQYAGPVLSFSCTVAAVAEYAGQPESEIRKLAECAADFMKHVPAEDWDSVVSRSLAIEKERKQQARDAEKRKADQRIAAATGTFAPAPAPSSGSQVKETKPQQASAGSRQKKSAAKSTDPGIKTTANPFAALGGDDDEEDPDGFTTVKKTKKR